MEKIEHVYSEDKAASEAKEITKTLNKESPDSNGVFSAEQYEEASRNIDMRQVELIKDISGMDFPAYLAGGYAADVLIQESGGVVSSDSFDAHADIDMVIRKEDIENLEEGIKSLGLNSKSRLEENQSVPSKLYLKNASGLQADFGVMDVSESGEPFIVTNVITNGYADVIKVLFSQDMFSYGEIVLDGKPIRVISPKSLIQSYSFYGQMRDKDRIRAQRLIDKYFPGEDLNSSKFQAKVVRLTI